MAKKKNKEELFVPEVYIPPSYYVYYDNKTGQILSVTNEKSDKYEYGFSAQFEEVENFLTGKCKFIDYIVSYKRLSENATELGIMPKTSEEYSFRNNVFEWITQNNKDSDLTVVWNGNSRAWRFLLKPGLIDRCKNLLTPRLVFFVTLEDDFDFLIRSIYIDTEQLSDHEVVVPFSTDIENKFNKISISTKLVFNTYRLKVENE